MRISIAPVLSQVASFCARRTFEPSCWCRRPSQPSPTRMGWDLRQHPRPLGVRQPTIGETLWICFGRTPGSRNSLRCFWSQSLLRLYATTDRRRCRCVVSGQKQYSNDYCSDAVWHNRQQTDANESPILHTHIANPGLSLGEIAECAHHAHILNQILQHTHDSESKWTGNDHCGWTEIMLK